MNEIAWHDIEAAFDSRQPVIGGYSNAERGVVTLASGKKVFVKRGIDESTKKWANREISAYQWLNRIHFPYAPQLLSAVDGAFAIEDLSALDFSHTWNDEKLAATFAAMDALEACEPPDTLHCEVVDIQNGWSDMLADSSMIEQLKLRGAAELQDISMNEIASYAAITHGLEVKDAVLAHMDIRGDNLAYDSTRTHVYLVDWNWLGYCNRFIDRTTFLTSVEKSGYKIPQKYHQYITHDAALFVAGFWLLAALKPVRKGSDPTLRDSQFDSALICLRWAKERL